MKRHKVSKYDGQTISIDGEPAYELGNYLGGGVAGVVYEAVHVETEKVVAIKILNPVGYRLMPTSSLKRCMVAARGNELEPEVVSSSFPMRPEHIWWMVHSNSKQVVPAYRDPSSGNAFREVPLPRCMEIWGVDPDDTISGQNKEVLVGGCSVTLPAVPAKYAKFVKHRKNFYREIMNMSQLGEHENVLEFLEVLELVQDSKCTIFLVLELAHGGELFDRIKIDSGTEEETARCYFQQLLSGVGYCHNHGVCHRDLKPENLLLASNEDGATLKIADFGLSAVFLSNTEEDEKAKTGPNASPLSMRRLTSVVGSPHYVAPEILENSGDNSGYDGTKSDVWSLGVILYAMLAGNLPFGKDLLQCKRFTKFSNWVQSRNAQIDSLLENDPDAEVNIDSILFPQWFFPQKFSDNAKDLISKLLQPDPSKRMTVAEARHHSWLGHENCSSTPVDQVFDEDCLSEAVILASMMPSLCESFVGSQERDSANLSGDVKTLTTFANQQKPGSDSVQAQTLTKPEASMSKPEAQPDIKSIFESVANDNLELPSFFSEPKCHGSETCDENTSNKNECTSDNLASDCKIDSEGPSPQRRGNEVSLANNSHQTHTPSLNSDNGVHPRSRELGNPGGSRSLSGRSFSSPLLSSPGLTGTPAPAPESPSDKDLRQQFSNAIFYSPPLAPLSFHEKNGLSFDGFSLDDDELPDIVKPAAEQRQNWAGRGRNVRNQRSHPNLFELQGSSPVMVGLPAGVSIGSQGTECAPPSFKDLVKRSTRFSTSVPAREVLARIQEIIDQDPYPFPYPFRNIPQRTTLEWTTYKLEVFRGGILVCTVQVYLLRTGLYMVEFLRGQLDIFQFKRFYEEVREKLSAMVKQDYFLQLLDSPNNSRTSHMQRGNRLSF